MPPGPDPHTHRNLRSLSWRLKKFSGFFFQFPCPPVVHQLLSRGLLFFHSTAEKICTVPDRFRFAALRHIFFFRVFLLAVLEVPPSM